MTNPKPYSGASSTRLTALINGENPRSIQPGVDFNFGAPEVFLGANFRNTRIPLISLKPEEYCDDVVFYRRLPLIDLYDLPAGSIRPVVVVTETFTIHGILADINAALGLDLAADEVQDGEFASTQSTVPLRINEGVSLAWIDSDFTFGVQYQAPGGDVPLSSVIAVTTLNGLNYEQP